MSASSAHPTAGTPASTARWNTARSGGPPMAEATTSTPAGSGRSGAQSIASGPVSHGLGGVGGRAGVAVGDQDPFDALGLRQLPGGPASDGAGAHEEDGGHRKSGSCSCRQPPLVGGAPPRPRRRSSQPTAPANPRATKVRRRAFMRGASWNRTSDLILIRDAL